MSNGQVRGDSYSEGCLGQTGKYYFGVSINTKPCFTKKCLIKLALSKNVPNSVAGNI